MDWRERLELKRRYLEILPGGMEQWAEHLCWEEKPPEVAKLGQAIVEWSGRTIGPLTFDDIPGGPFWNQKITVRISTDPKATDLFEYTINQLSPFHTREFIGSAFKEFLKKRGVLKSEKDSN